MAKKRQSIEAWIHKRIAEARQLDDRLFFRDAPPQIDEPAAKKAFALVAAEFPECRGLHVGPSMWFDDQWLSALAAQAHHLQQLQSLSLGETRVSDGGLQALAAQAQHFQQLQLLNFRGTQ